MLFYMRKILTWFLFFFCAFPVVERIDAQTTEDSRQTMQDAKVYLEQLEKIKDTPIPQQIQAWQNFLEENPNTAFREEIESNIENLNELLLETDPKRKKEQMDSQRYIRASIFAKKLNPNEQIELWEQFLEENPDSIFRSEVQSRLRELRSQQRPKIKRPKRKPTAQPKPFLSDRVPITRNLPYKSPQKATLLATFPGLIVPGMGHWYTEDYVFAGILTGVRVGGLAVGIPGIVKRNTPMIVSGALIAFFSYIADALDAPFSARRYNEKLDQENPSAKLEIFSPSSLGLSITF